METPRLPVGIRELPVIAGDLALDFANTVDDPLGPERHDHIADYRSLLWWAVRMDLLTETEADHLGTRVTPRRAAAVVGRASQLREAINLTAGSVADGREFTGWSQLRPFVHTSLEHAELVERSAAAGTNRLLRPTWPRDDAEALLWPVANAAYELLTGPRASRIKRCAGCPWLFLDQSKNGSRRWCSMEICGTNEKVRLYVSRRAARRASD